MSPSQKSVSKMVTGKREADFMKITENCQKLLANKQKNCIFLKNFKCKHTFLGLSKRSLVNLYCNVLFVDLAISGSQVMAKIALKCRSRLLQ